MDFRGSTQKEVIVDMRGRTQGDVIMDTATVLVGTMFHIGTFFYCYVIVSVVNVNGYCNYCVTVSVEYYIQNCETN